MQIEAGKYYRTRSGHKVGPMRASEIKQYPFIGVIEGVIADASFTAGGAWAAPGEADEWDLVSEWADETTGIVYGPPVECDMPTPSGISLRDFFAGCAMAGLAGVSITHERTAKEAYRFAEAMLAARSK